MASESSPTSNTAPHHTCVENANKHPAEILVSTGTVQKKHTKAEKVADNQCLKEEKMAKEEAAKAAIARLGAMEMAAEEKAASELQRASKAKAPRPLPSPKTLTQKECSGSEGRKTEAKGSSMPALSLLGPSTPLSDKPENEIIVVRTNQPLGNFKEVLQDWKANQKGKLEVKKYGVQKE
ncbi:hypothetical protein JVT61DRAFT_10980 [Boletus reticuloceps]|uniref:Uncharacterized protein n=1 Tax=Boletus reticuloceps TaxID=495285 RepID=A0A8I3A3T9_9AGAM|nr:hypothetical protein JVT61DRAFT_10980 [Boletus reticuloceps]